MFALVLAVTSFVGPLWGIHQLLAAEQERRMGEVSRLVDKLTSEVHARVETGDLTDADRRQQTLGSLLAERELLARAPTWLERTLT